MYHQANQEKEAAKSQCVVDSQTPVQVIHIGQFDGESRSLAV